MKTILHVLDCAAAPKEVFDALTTAEGLGAWWTTQVIAEPTVGSIVRFTFLEGFNPQMKVTELEESARVGWTCVGGHDPWRDNTFSFEIATIEGGKTRVRFRQDYAIELGDDRYGIYNYNWGYYLESLRLLLDEGRGKPYEARG